MHLLYFWEVDVAERDFQRKLIKRIKEEFPGCYVTKADSAHRQGVPDLTILHGENWAALEVKTSQQAAERPNQRYHVDTLNSMSFAAFIYPENEEDVFYDLQQALRPRR